MTRSAGVMVAAGLLMLELVVTGCTKRPVAIATPTATGAASSVPVGSPGVSRSARGDDQAGGARPSSIQPGPGEFSSASDLGDIHFELDQYAVRSEDTKILITNAEWLKSHRDVLVLIEGHCDERGTAEYNLALGDRRAKAALNSLVAQGVEATRISIVSYGKEQPVCREKNEACWGRNRRDHFLVKAR